MEIYNKNYDDEVSEDDVRAFDLLKHCVQLGEKYGGDHNKEIEDYYSSDYFWQNIKPKAKAVESLMKLKDEGFELVLISNGDSRNLERKLSFAKEVLPMFDRYIFLCQHQQPFTKSDINMDDCFFIDDYVKYLNESNATVKIMLGKESRGNRNPGYFSSVSWEEIYRYIHRIYDAHLLLQDDD